MDPLDLERRIDRRLKALPLPHAPASLVPRVMAAVQVAAARQARAWFAWSPVWQAVSLAGFAAAAVGLVAVWPTLVATVTGPAATALSPLLSLVDAFRAVADGFASAGAAVDRTVLQPVALVVATLMMLMVAACAVFGSALGHVLAGGASES